MRIKPVNPVAKAIAQSRRRTATQVVQPKKGKGAARPCGSTPKTQAAKDNETIKELRDANRVLQDQLAQRLAQPTTKNPEPKPGTEQSQPARAGEAPLSAAERKISVGRARVAEDAPAEAAVVPPFHQREAVAASRAGPTLRVPFP